MSSNLSKYLDISNFISLSNAKSLSGPTYGNSMISDISYQCLPFNPLLQNILINGISLLKLLMSFNTSVANLHGAGSFLYSFYNFTAYEYIYLIVLSISSGSNLNILVLTVHYSTLAL